MAEGETSVRVGLRIRPQLAREKIDACRVCTSVIPGEPQVVLGNDKAFTFDHVFDLESGQEEVYRTVAYDLIEGCLDGYNATILAYGQTGSGKTYSMGTGFDMVAATPSLLPPPTAETDHNTAGGVTTTDRSSAGGNESGGSAMASDVGIIPRGVFQLFDGIRRREEEAKARDSDPPVFQVHAQFMELYNEEVYDLLGVSSGGVMHSSSSGGEERRPGSGVKSTIKIHEDTQGGIYTVGLTSRQVRSLEETMQCLKAGALCRTTASTSMNSQSSRSHAVFTLQIKQQRLIHPQLDDEGKEEDTSVREFESLQAKFHFVDLAGSERLKRTMATGDRAKEGISINCGLLALGNVISALGDKAKKGSHVPYRDSKLTRLLQDSLGGNSRTVMIACISPSDRDFMETLNTLKYANRARNIKNRVTMNQDKTSKQLSELRGEIQRLSVELLEYKQGKRIVGTDGVEHINDMFHENSLLQAEADKLRIRVKALQETVNNLASRNTVLEQERAVILASAITGDDADEEVKKMVKGYVSELEGLRTRLIETEAMCEHLRRAAGTARHAAAMASTRINLTSSSLTPRAGGSITSADGFGSSSPFFGDTSLSSASLRDGLSNLPEMDVTALLEVAKQDVESLKMKVSVGDKDLQGVDIIASSDSGTGVSPGGGDDIVMSSSGPADEEGQQDEGHVSEGREDSQEKSSEENEEEGGELSPVGRGGETGAFEEEDEIEEDIDETTDSESDKEDEHLHADLAELTSEITIKQRLIEELEKSQRQLNTIRQQYENKLCTLHDQIKSTEKERDDILKNLSERKTESSDTAKKVRQDYEKRLGNMQTELKKLNSAKREHSKLLRNQTHYDRQLKALQGELLEMKKIKVKLMTQMSADSARNKESEKKRLREMSKLKKESQQRLLEIKNLEMKGRQKDVVLRRRLEEVDSLRRKQNQRQAARKPATSRKTNGGNQSSSSSPGNSTTPTPFRRSTSLSSTTSASAAGSRGRTESGGTKKGSASAAAPKFSVKGAKGKWDGLEHHVSSVVVRRQTVAAMEREMDVHIRRREELSRRMDYYNRDLDRALQRRENTLVTDLEDQLEGLVSNMGYVQANISECQNSIMQMEEEAAKEESSSRFTSVLESLSLEEAKYCLEHFISYGITKGFDLTQKDATVRETEAKLRRSQMDSRLREQLLSQFVEEQCEEMVVDSPYNWGDADGPRSRGSSRSRSSSPVSRILASEPSSFTPLSADAADGADSTLTSTSGEGRSGSSSPTPRRGDKARCRTSTTSDLLFAGSLNSSDSPGHSPPPSSPQLDDPFNPSSGRTEPRHHPVTDLSSASASTSGLRQPARWETSYGGSPGALDESDSGSVAMVTPHQRPPLPNLADLLPPAPRLPYIEPITEESEPEEEEIIPSHRASFGSASSSRGSVGSACTFVIGSTSGSCNADIGGSAVSGGCAITDLSPNNVKPANTTHNGKGSVKAKAAVFCDGATLSLSSHGATSPKGLRTRRLSDPGSIPNNGGGGRTRGGDVLSKIVAIESGLQNSSSNGSLHGSDKGDSSPSSLTPRRLGSRNKLTKETSGRVISGSSIGIRQGSYTILSSAISSGSSLSSSNEDLSPSVASGSDSLRDRGRCYILDQALVSEAHSTTDIPSAVCSVPLSALGSGIGSTVSERQGRTDSDNENRLAPVVPTKQSPVIGQGESKDGGKDSSDGLSSFGMSKWRGIQVDHLDTIDSETGKLAVDTKENTSSNDSLPESNRESYNASRNSSATTSTGDKPFSSVLTAGVDDRPPKIEGRRKLSQGHQGSASPTLRRKQFNGIAPNDATPSSPGSLVSTASVTLKPSRSRERLLDSVAERTPPSSPAPSRRSNASLSLTTTPSSPTPFRRSVRGGTSSNSGGTGTVLSGGGDDVFVRLSGRRRRQGDTGKRGEITAKPAPVASSVNPLTWTHTAKGHTRAVLDVCSYDHLLFSASKDCTCKVWDTNVGVETHALVGHPNNVTKVRYLPDSRLAFTASMSYVRVWDMRSKANCVKVLSSSGLVHDEIPTDVSGRQSTTQPGESVIFDIQLSACGRYLYTTAGNFIRIWDLNSFTAVGKINTGHQGPVTAMCTGVSPNKTPLLVSGSKDHYIKVTEVGSVLSGPLLQPSYTLEPPHYDGIQALALAPEGGAPGRKSPGGSQTLFTGSRDRCIKMWNLTNHSLVQSMNAAHNNWVTDLACLNSTGGDNLLLSSCRSGQLKLWKTGASSFTFLDAVLAHSSGVNALSVCGAGRNVYTASSNGCIGIWKLDRSVL